MKYIFQTMGGINWTWVLCYQLVEGGARILFHERWHNFDHNMMPEWVCKGLDLRAKMERTPGDSASIKENGIDRTAIALTFSIYEEIGPKDYPYHFGIDGRRYRNIGTREIPIINPKCTFHYRDFDEVKEWIENGASD